MCFYCSQDPQLFEAGDTVDVNHGHVPYNGLWTYKNDGPFKVFAVKPVSLRDITCNGGGGNVPKSVFNPGAGYIKLPKCHAHNHFFPCPLEFGQYGPNCHPQLIQLEDKHEPGKGMTVGGFMDMDPNTPCFFSGIRFRKRKENATA